MKSEWPRSFDIREGQNKSPTMNWTLCLVINSLKPIWSYLFCASRRMFTPLHNVSIVFMFCYSAIKGLLAPFWCQIFSPVLKAQHYKMAGTPPFFCAMSFKGCSSGVGVVLYKTLSLRCSLQWQKLSVLAPAFLISPSCQMIGYWKVSTDLICKSGSWDTFEGMRKRTPCTVWYLNRPVCSSEFTTG